MNPLVGILVTTFNDDPTILNRLLASAYQQSYLNVLIICVDDGSERQASECIEFPFSEDRLALIRIPHSERAAARNVGMQALSEAGVSYFLFVDSDMVLPPDIIQNLVMMMNSKPADGYVIPEESFSYHHNFWTQIKVFERNLYQVGCTIHQSSIEAARFWKMSSFPGFETNMNAFEEIQPTIRCLRDGGIILKYHLPLLHDEKLVTFQSMMKKKAYYFDDMSSHSKDKIIEMIKRFYFFRAQLYHRENLRKYVRHPLKTMAVILMYIVLSAAAIKSTILQSRSESGAG